jgi:hypothetical protein
VEAVIDQPLRDVVDRDTGGAGQRSHVDDALVRDQTVLARVQHGIVVA